MTESTPMMTPAELKAFHADVQVVRDTFAPAKAYLFAEDKFAEAGEELRQRWKAAFDCGAALRRIHDSESYRDTYGDWTAFMRAVGVTRTHCYRLMKCADILATLPTAMIGRIDMPLSIRTVEALGALPEGERVELCEEVAKADNLGDAFDRLRETLKSVVQTGDAKPGVPRAPRGIEWARKHTSALERWFRDLGADERAAPIIREIERLAELILQSRQG